MLYVAGAAFLFVIAVVVAGSFVRPDPLTFIPTPIAPQPPVDGFVVDTVTIDARDGSQWVHFDFDKGSAVDGPLAGSFAGAVGFTLAEPFRRLLRPQQKLCAEQHGPLVESRIDGKLIRQRALGWCP